MLSYGHLLFIAAIVLVSVGLHEAVAEPAEYLHRAGLVLLYGGSALFLATFGLTRWAMFRLVSVTRLSAAAVVLVAILPATLLPAWAALLLLALILAALNLLELIRNDTTGWRTVFSDKTGAA